MEQSTKTRKLAEMLDEAEQRSAALSGLSDLINSHTEVLPRALITPSSSEKEFKKVNDALDDYTDVFYASNSLAMISNDLLRIISEANMLMFDTNQVIDNVDRFKRVKNIINDAFEAGLTYTAMKKTWHC